MAKDDRGVLRQRPKMVEIDANLMDLSEIVLIFDTKFILRNFLQLLQAFGV